MDESTKGLRSFAAVERFLAEASGDARRAGYVLLGDEAFLQQSARRGVLDALLPEDMREFSLHDLDLGETTIFDALDLAQTPSLMAPFQVLILRNLKALYGRGQKKDEFRALDEYFRSPNPGALLLFIADHIALPQDLRRMDFTDKERAERIRETLGDLCGIVELQQVSEDDAVAWVERTAERGGVRFSDDAARELVDSLGADMLAIASEVEKLMLYAGPGATVGAAAGAQAESAGAQAESAGAQAESAGGRGEIDVRDVEAMVTAAKQRTLYELTDAISQKDAPRSLALLSGLLNASEGGEDAAIGHVFALAKTFRQMLVLHENRVTDQRAVWGVLWPGFRPAPFAADALIAQARRYRDRNELKQALRWIAKTDLDLRSSPPDKRLVLERLVLRLAGKSREAVEV